MAFLAVLLDELEILADIDGEKGQPEAQPDPHRLLGERWRCGCDHKTKGGEPIVPAAPFAPRKIAARDVSRLFHRQSDCARCRGPRSPPRRHRRLSSKPAACAQSRRPKGCR